MITFITCIIKFSTSDNAFLAFLSRFPAIIPTFDLIWELMRQMWLGIQFFLWEAKLLRQKKSKFGELSTEEIHRGYYTVARRYEFYFRVAKQYFTNERRE